VRAGQCCGTCVGADGPLCDPAGYRAFRDRLIAERGAQTCGPTDHCAGFGINSRCEVDCGTITLADQAAPLASSLLAFAELMCRGCPMPEPCPPRRFVPQCVNGACALGPP
jgi:hypothetical protein